MTDLSKPYNPAAFSAVVMYKPYGSNLPYRRMGDCEKITIKTKAKEIKRGSGEVFGGTHSLDYIIDDVTIDLSQSDFTLENITRAFFGDSTVLLSESVVDEVHQAYKAAFIPLCPNPSGIVVKSEDGQKTFKIGSDYTVNSGGIEIVSGSEITTSADTPTPIKVSYNKPSIARIEGFVNNNVQLSLMLLVKNNIGSRKATNHELYKVQFDPAATIDYVSGGKNAELNVTGKVIVDQNRPIGDGTNLYSQMMRIEAAV